MVYYKVAEGATFTYMNLGRVETEQDHRRLLARNVDITHAIIKRRMGSPGLRHRLHALQRIKWGKPEQLGIRLFSAARKGGVRGEICSGG